MVILDGACLEFFPPYLVSGHLDLPMSLPGVTHVVALTLLFWACAQMPFIFESPIISIFNLAGSFMSSYKGSEWEPVIS